MVGRLRVKRILLGWSSLIFRYIFLLHKSLSNDCFFAIEQRNKWLLGLWEVPQQLHGNPTPSIPLGPTHCLRRSERSDYGDRGVPDLLCAVAHALPGAFCGAGGNRSLHRRSQRTRRPAQHRRDVFVCFYTAPELSAGLSLSKACHRGWKGKHPLLLAFTQAIP